MLGKRTTITIQFIQDGIIVYHHNKLNTYHLISVENYKFINKQLFYEELSNIINENNINNHLLTDNINIIIDNTYTNLELDNIKSIFKELSFNKITFINLINIFHLNKNELLIDISNNIIKIYYNNDIININIYFNKYKQLISIYLKELLKKENINIIKVFGDYKEINNIITYLEKTIFKEIYSYSYPELMPIKLLT